MLGVQLGEPVRVRRRDLSIEGEGGDALRWVRPVELHGLAMPRADKPLIGLLEALV